MAPRVRIRLHLPKVPPSPPPADTAYVKDSLEFLKEAFEMILNDEAIRVHSFEALYRVAYNLILQRKGDLVYKLATHAMRRARTLDPLERHRAKRMIRDVCMYLDRVYCTSHKLPLLWDIDAYSLR